MEKRLWGTHPGSEGLVPPHTKVTEKLRGPKGGAVAPLEHPEGQEEPWTPLPASWKPCLRSGTEMKRRKSLPSGASGLEEVPHREPHTHSPIPIATWGPSGGLWVSAAAEVPSSVRCSLGSEWPLRMFMVAPERVTSGH